jgi:hypothetical protein
MPTEEIARHLKGMLGYIASLDDDQKRQDAASYALSHTKIVLGLVSTCEFEENHEIWLSLFKIADKYNAFIFTSESLWLPNGAVLVGPMRDGA